MRSLFKKLDIKLDYLTEEQVDQVYQAYLMAVEAHRGQKRFTGEPFITHPIAVASILSKMHLDHQTIIAALLHDVIEDTTINKQTLTKNFGQTVADLVDGVSKLTQIEFINRAEAQAENFRKMVLAMSRDIRVILVKLADRLHNMRTLSCFDAQKQHRIAKETLEIFAPIAKRLGMHDLSVELEELGFRGMYPRRYAILQEAVNKTRGNRKKILNVIQKKIEEAISKTNCPPCTIIGREKHLYSIYRKMRTRHLPFNEVMDVYAFRIIVDDVDTCYRILGIVHQLFKPVAERFKDYIAIPKTNSYQSLHTTLFGPYGLPIEVQIRTKKMDQMASSGIAAHWLYKSDQKDLDVSQARAQQWVRDLLELQRNAENPIEFIRNAKIDLFPDEVYVFTPQGDILSLPAGATAVDFAYAVHTDIGNSCIAVKINRQPVPLSTVLANGQTIEVITSAYGRPNPAWLDFVVTGKAYSAIRHFFKSQRKKDSIALGEALLKRALESYDLSIKGLPNKIMDVVLNEVQLDAFEDLLEEIGLGNRISTLVAQRLADMMGKIKEIGIIKQQPAKGVPLLIRGTEGMALHFAHCCYPIPGDPIVGVFQVGKGIIVHTNLCKQIKKLRHHPERLMALRWAEDITDSFTVVIRLEVIDQPRLLAKLATAIADTQANIEDIRIESRNGQHCFFQLKLAVQNRRHLAQVIRKARRLPAIHKITRWQDG